MTDSSDLAACVKPLEWDGPLPANGYKKGRWNADAFSVVRKGKDYWRVYRNLTDEKDAIYGTEEAAKAAAQADYARRILSALIPGSLVPASAVEAARVEEREACVKSVENTHAFPRGSRSEPTIKQQYAAAIHARGERS